MNNISKRSDLHEASFSSYVTREEENFVVKLTESVPLPNPVTISTPGTSLPIGLERTKPEEGEINVFDAERYFNMRLDDGSPKIIDTINFRKYGHENENQVRPPRTRPKSSLGTPSVSSEASYNSQTAFLPGSNMRDSSQSRHHQKVNERWFFSGFACKGSCTDKKSVYIDHNVAHRGVVHGKHASSVVRSPMALEGRRQPQARIQARDEFHSPSFEKRSIGSKRSEYMVLPTVNSGVQNLVVKREEQKKIMQDQPRHSLEVFGSHMIKSEDIAQNLERKLSVLTWDAIPKSPTLPATSAGKQMYEDIESDASSDLFEIDNISTSTQPMFIKKISDGISGCMTPPSGYAPSETSIEWSVVTASAADFSSVADYDEKMVAENCRPSPGSASTPKRNRPNSLLGCKSQKAVDVAETAYKRNHEKAKSHRRPDIPTPPRKLQADIKVKAYDFI
ncbi:hypothetical protein Tsubulata_013081 [Turnera subulata]|uniref:Phytochrome kinase substrate 1 n=1 Tax=Turnera subulata TaxID=218843 RepID=A0A9Q0J1G2_9ROSI|nr:hypothetical protein Tsubulata_013081 [Turnera subulata]